MVRLVFFESNRVCLDIAPYIGFHRIMFGYLHDFYYL